MVIQQQSTSVPISTAVQTSSGDNYLTMSVLMTFLVLIIGGWPSLLCTISALMISYNVSKSLHAILYHFENHFSILPHQAKDDEKRGNIAAARTKANISLGLNIAAVVFVVAMWSVVAIPVAVTVSAQTSAAQLPAISTPSTVLPTTSTVRPTTSTPTPYCYSTQNPSDCSSSYCYYGSYTYYYYYYYYYSYTYYYYSCLYSAYYSSSSYSYSSYSYYYYYSQYCYSPTYSLTCSYG